MSKRLYYSCCSIAAPHIGVIIDDILDGRQAGDEVYWAYCHTALTSCWMNPDGYDSVCRFCHRMYHEYQRVFGKGVHMLPVKKPDTKHQNATFDFQDAEALRNFVYRDVEVGNAILSMYYTGTRDLDLKRFEEFHDFAVPLIGELCNLVDTAYLLIKQVRPDIIVIHNGRLYENRLFYDIAKALGIHFKAVETVGGHGEPYAKMSYHDELPHNIKMWDRMIKRLWEESPESDVQKRETAASFYEKRRKGQLVVDVKVYVADQVTGLLPEGFDPNKRNVAIYTSSQDELAALGRDVNGGQLFDSQSDAMGYIFSHSPANIHYYLRIHPNLKGVTYKDHTDLYQYASFPNVTVIAPESKISSYALIDACEKVISFGSSVGVEASYWGKPSILIGHSAYEGLDACYVVKEKEEIIPLIEGNLDAKPQLGALKYAYFLLDRKYKTDKTHIDIDVRTRTYRWTFTFASYLKLWNSQTLYQMAYFWYCILLRRFTKKRHNFPWRSA